MKPSALAYYPHRKPMSVTRVGEWGKLLPLARALRSVGPELHKIMYAEAQLAAARIKRRLRNRYYDGEWEPLTPEWAQRKRRERLDPRMMIAHGDYIDHIGVLYAGPYIVQIGIDRNAKNRDGDNLAGIGYIHEFGAGDVPARPHWRNEYREMEQALHYRLVHLANRIRGAVK